MSHVIPGTPSPVRCRLGAMLSGGWLLVLGCRGTDTTRVWIDAGPAGSREDVAAVAPSLLPDDAGASAADAAFVGACGVGRPAAYAFESRFVPGQSSVSYASAVGTRALIADVQRFVVDLSAGVDAGTSYAQGELVARFEELLVSPVASLALDDLVPAAAGALQGEPADLAVEGGLSAALAGSRPETEFRPWGQPGTFAGFADFDLGRGHPDGFTPRLLLRALAEELEINAGNRSLGFLQRAPDATILPVHVTRDGRDLSELVARVLHAAVVFSGVTDDLLDDATAGRGLLSSSARSDGATYSPLENVWDLAFGHYGAARDHDRYTAEEVAGVGGRSDRGRGFHDTNADCRVNLLSEVNQGDAVLAALRDHEAGSLTDLGGGTFRSLLAARRIVADGEPSDGQRLELSRFRDAAVAAWEAALAATAIHHLGELSVLIDRAVAGLDSYRFVDQALHWSALKGISLAFQFNPRSPLSRSDFDELHDLLRDAPAVPDALPPGNAAELLAYLAELSRARALLQSTYGFSEAEVERW